MSIETIHNLIKQAEIELAQLVEQEEQEKARETECLKMYVFVYEQYFPDLQIWAPNEEHIQARTTEGAFGVLGRVIDVLHLQIRNIRYGLWSEMQEEMASIKQYWNEQHEKGRYEAE